MILSHWILFWIYTTTYTPHDLIHFVIGTFQNVDNEQFYEPMAEKKEDCKQSLADKELLIYQEEGQKFLEENAH